ncbi:uncharacterized protein LOC106714755 [Papilio machaon]|uniref:uncharacterized protein LOC106714755 n=1 Tax=Papilio machaon TaxID=76193 RepID=UPI001E665027|nr:uncharacterized protein LOC106714755 [Papilio machaon]
MYTIVLLCLLGAVYAVPDAFLDSVSDCYDYEDKFLCFDNFKNGLAYRFGFEQPEGRRQQKREGFIKKDSLSKGFLQDRSNDGVRHITKNNADDNEKKSILEMIVSGRVPEVVIASMLG